MLTFQTRQILAIIKTKFSRSLKLTEMSQLLVQIYKLSHTVLRTKAKLVKVEALFTSFNW